MKNKLCAVCGGLIAPARLAVVGEWKVKTCNAFCSKKYRRIQQTEGMRRWRSRRRALGFRTDGGENGNTNCRA